MLSKTQKDLLLYLARRSIAHGLEHQTPLEIQLKEFDKDLKKQRATFVTLKHQEKLRGCIGVLEAYRPLVEDVVENAFASAFKDTRFPPLAKKEFDKLVIHISVLSEPEPLKVTSENDLLQKITKGQDGLILKEGPRHATFLPSVWEEVQMKYEFLVHLKNKAGLTSDYWSDTMQFYKYTTEGFGEN